jgi:hypothetical protein
MVIVIAKGGQLSSFSFAAFRMEDCTVQSGGIPNMQCDRRSRGRGEEKGEEEKKKKKKKKKKKRGKYCQCWKYLRTPYFV